MTDFFIRAQKGWLVDRKIFHSLDILCKKVNILEYKLFGVRALYKSLRKLDRRMNLNFIFLLGSFVDINRRLFLFFFFLLKLKSNLMILSSKDLNCFRIHGDEETIHQRDIVISHSAFVTINRLVGMTCSLTSIIIIIHYSVKKKRKEQRRHL